MKTLKHLFVIAIALSVTIPCFGKRIDLKKNRGHKKRTIETAPAAIDYAENEKTLSLWFYEVGGAAYVTVSDAAGNVVYSDMADVNEAEPTVIDLQNLPAGTYSLSLFYGTTAFEEYSGTLEID